jgi:energy-converting hydrogenase Eha subunit B
VTAVGIAFIVLGIVLLFIVPWAGIATGVAGLVLAILWVAGFGHPRTALGSPPCLTRAVC